MRGEKNQINFIFRSLEYINDYMSLPKCGEIGRAFLSTFVNDLLIFGCVTISKTIDERPNTLVYLSLFSSFILSSPLPLFFSY